MVSIRSTLALCVSFALSAAPSPAQEIGNPELFEKSLKAAEQALNYYGAYDNRDEARRIADIGYRVAQESGFTKFPFSFYLVEMPVPNAFALPGGHIFMTRGMLDLGLDDDMLAGLLGHEIGHVVEQHGIRIQKRATLLNILSQALLVGVLISSSNSNSAPSPTYDPYGYSGGSSGGNRVLGAAAAGAVVSELLLRSYSREFEDEADDEGQRMAAAAGFDPDGTRRLMAKMKVRLPQTQEYGYWRTHPFFEQRVLAASVRQGLLKIQPPSSADAYRQRTQAVLLDFEPRKPLEDGTAELLKIAALAAWPRGARADELRSERLAEIKEVELARPELSRDLGRLTTIYRDELDEIDKQDPDSRLVAEFNGDIASFKDELARLYEKATETFRGGVFETEFLQTFLSNYPEAPEVAEVALALGNAYSRLGKSASAVEQYLTAQRHGGDGVAGKQAHAGLVNLAPYLDRLVALEPLVVQDEDAELRRLAEKRLAVLAESFEELSNGADYLKRYPEGLQSATVAKRLDSLADSLYGEVVLYQSVGDHAKALDRIQRILTQAPLSRAAERLREQVILES